MSQIDIPELNAETRPRFQAWLDAHNVRATCPACESPTYALTSRIFTGVFPGYPDNYAVYQRICRDCGHILGFDIREQIQAPTDAPPSEMHPPAGSQ